MAAPSRALSHVLYGLLVLQGLGMLFPWNAFITCTGYYETAFAGSPYAGTAEARFALAFTVTNVLGLGVGMALESLSLRERVLLPLVVQTLIFALIALVALIDALPPPALFWGLMLCVSASSILSALLQGGIFAFTATLPPAYTNGVLAGQALSGLVVALSNFAIVAVQRASGEGTSEDLDPQAERRAAVVYYVVSAGVMASCVAGYFAMVRTKPVGLQGRGSELDAVIHDAATEAPAPTGGGQSWRFRDTLASWCRLRRSGVHHAMTAEHAEDTSVGPTSVEQQPPSDSPDLRLISDWWRGSSRRACACVRRRALRAVSLHAFALWAVFAVTLAVFPAIVAEVRPPAAIAGWPSWASRALSHLFTPGAFVLFNLGDLVGRWLAAPFPVRNPSLLVALSLLRVGFIPALVSCAMQSDRSLATGDVVLTGPGAFASTMLAFAMSNGYIASCVFMDAPGRVHAEDMEFVGRAMPLFLAAGLACGSALAIALHLIVRP